MLSPADARRRRCRAALALLLAATVGGTSATSAAASSGVPGEPAGPDAAAAAAMSGLVDREDARIRQLVRGLEPGTAPQLARTSGTTTLVLPARPAPYRLSSLVELGAVERVGARTYLLRTSVLVGPGAALHLAQPGATLRMASGPGGFVSLVNVRGALSMTGSPSEPMLLVGWDVTTGATDRTATDGRAYVRSMGGAMRVDDVDVSRLGFWSARTGGLAWTGTVDSRATGSATRVRARRSHYGAFLSEAEGVALRASAFEGNAAGGVVVHNRSTRISVDAVTVAGNGGDGIKVDRGSSDVTISDSAVRANGRSGVVLDGAALADGPSIDGSAVHDYAGLVVRGGEVTDNAETGVLVVGGREPLVEGVRISGGRNGVWARDRVEGLVVRANEVLGAREVGVKLSGGVTAAVVTGNVVDRTRTGVRLVDSAAAVQQNRIRGATHHAVSLLGRTDGTTVVSNTFSGSGAAAVHGADRPGATVAGNRDGEWTQEFDVATWLRTYPSEHPVALLWLLLLLLPVATAVQRRRFRDRPSLVAHPYATTQRPLVPLPDAAPEPDPARDGQVSGTRVTVVLPP